jgi:hypothetical protein
VSHSPINSQGVEVDTLPATHLKTILNERKKKTIFFKLEFGDSFFGSVRRD